jgi:murein DD-endopeptidase MepM/ murein hydrolase activator NlpD
MDFTAKTGTPIFATGDGVVQKQITLIWLWKSYCDEGMVLVIKLVWTFE